MHFTFYCTSFCRSFILIYDLALNSCFNELCQKLQECAIISWLLLHLRVRWHTFRQISTATLCVFLDSWWRKTFHTDAGKIKTQFAFRPSLEICQWNDTSITNVMYNQLYYRYVNSSKYSEIGYLRVFIFGVIAKVFVFVFLY